MGREGTSGGGQKKNGGDDWVFFFGFVPRCGVVSLTQAQLQIS